MPKPKTEDDVIQATLELFEQLGTGHTLEEDGLLEVVPELAFLGEVNALGFLLFAQLQTVAYNFGLLVFPVLSGSEVAFLNRAFVAEALGAFQEKLDAFPATKTTHCIRITSHVILLVSMTGLQVWLHPSSRTKSVVSQLSVISKSLRNPRFYWVPVTETGRFLHSTTFRRTATVVRNRRGVFNRPHFDSGRSQGADG